MERSVSKFDKNSTEKLNGLGNDLGRLVLDRPSCL